MDSMHLIVGLGNPGKEYAETRHNIGFLLVERLARQWRVKWKADRKFASRTAQVEIENAKVLLCQPQTFMNGSGEAVQAVMAYYRISIVRMLVAVDDADLPLGEIRLRPSGGTGGHHGLESVEQHVGTRDYARLRLGIGRGPGLREITGHVLGKFAKAESPLLELVLDRAVAQVECWVHSGTAKAMNNFNGVVVHPDNKGTNQ